MATVAGFGIESGEEWMLGALSGEGGKEIDKGIAGWIVQVAEV